MAVEALDEIGTCAVTIDPERLRSALTHLVQNAVDVSCPGDRVIISSHRFGTRLLIEVTDNGPGMDDAFVRHELFLPFRSTKSGGYGIGAFQTRELIRMAGSDLEVISEKGFGTRMRIILPLVSEREAGEILRRDLNEMLPNPKPLLLVDDDTGLLRQLRWAFSDHKVFPAGSRQEAIDFVRGEPIPVAIVDLGLPPDPDGASEGLATLTEILAIAPATKVVIATGNETREHALRAIALGAYDFYQKPIDIDVLQLIVSRAERMFELEDENRRLAEVAQTSAGRRHHRGQPGNAAGAAQSGKDSADRCCGCSCWARAVR